MTTFELNIHIGILKSTMKTTCNSVVIELNSAIGDHVESRMSLTKERPGYEDILFEYKNYEDGIKLQIALDAHVDSRGKLLSKQVSYFDAMFEEWPIQECRIAGLELELALESHIVTRRQLLEARKTYENIFLTTDK